MENLAAQILGIRDLLFRISESYILGVLAT